VGLELAEGRGGSLHAGRRLVFRGPLHDHLGSPITRILAHLRGRRADRAIPGKSSEPTWPSLEFTEPNVGFGVEVQEAGDVVLRVHFNLESAPPWLWVKRLVDEWQFFVKVSMTDDDLRDAATSWLTETAAFPLRGEEP
jgi:hypothetical protein